MALKIEKRGEGMVKTTDPPKPHLCHTCKQRKTGIFGIDPNGNPQCGDCGNGHRPNGA